MSFNREGLTEFPVDGVSRRFKYAVSVANERLRVWLEDTSTLLQWQTECLSVEDFTTLATTIPRAGAVIYAEHISGCLDLTNASTKNTRQLSSVSGTGARELCVSFELQALEFTTSLEYTFSLGAVELSSMELMASRARGLEEEVTELFKKNQQLRANFQQLRINRQSTPSLLCQVKDTLVAVVTSASERLARLRSDAADVTAAVSSSARPPRSATIHDRSTAGQVKHDDRPAHQHSGRILMVVGGFAALCVYLAFRTAPSHTQPDVYSPTSAKKSPIVIDRRLLLSNADLGTCVPVFDPLAIDRCYDVDVLVRSGFTAAALSKIGPHGRSVMFTPGQKHPGNGFSRPEYVELLVKFDGKPWSMPSELLTQAQWQTVEDAVGGAVANAKFLWKKALEHGGAVVQGSIDGK